MSELLEKNIECLKSERPELWEALQGAYEEFLSEEHSSRYTLTKDLPHNLMASTSPSSSPDWYHAPQPLEEARQVIKQADLKYPQIVFVFGCGLGYLPELFLESRPTSNYALILVEKDPQVFFQWLSLKDLRPLLEDHSIHFFVGFERQRSQAELTRIFYSYSTVMRVLKILATPSEIKRYSDYYSELAKVIMSTRDRAVYSAGNSIEDSFEGFQNICGNIEFALKSPGLAPLMDQFEGRTILSVAAGPDLERHWDQVKALQGKIPIVTCDTLLKAFLERGIVPDFVTAIERVLLVSTFFEGVEVPERTSLVGPLLLHPKTLQNFKGRQLLYCPTVQNAAGLGFPYLGHFFPGSSAGNLNIDLACRLGFQNIILIGHNLAYGLDSKTSHVKGTAIKTQDLPKSEDEIARESRGMKLPTQDGKDVVHTKFFWKQFLEQIEDTIGSHPTKRFINTAAKGARISGTELMSLEEALHELQVEDFDIYPEKLRLLKSPDPDKSEQIRKRVYENLKAQRDRMKFWLERVEDLHQQILKWRKKIEEKELLGKSVSLDFLNEKLGEVLKLKVEAVNEDPVFYQAAMTTLLPGHLALERELNEMPATYTDNTQLKRDFLLKHDQYFALWLHWLPRLISEIEKHQIPD